MVYWLYQFSSMCSSLIIFWYFIYSYNNFWTAESQPRFNKSTQRITASHFIKLRAQQLLFLHKGNYLQKFHINHPCSISYAKTSPIYLLESIYFSSKMAFSCLPVKFSREIIYMRHLSEFGVIK